MAKNVDTLRGDLAKLQETQDELYAKFKQAEKRTRAKGRELIAALAGDLDLSPAERKALGLRKGAA